MTKFFLPKQKGQKDHLQKDKKKKITPNCNESLSTDIATLLKKMLTRQIQRTIRKIHEASEQKVKQKLQSRLVQLKSLSKHDIKALALHILQQQLNVEEDNLKTIATKILGDSTITINDPLKNFFEVLKKKEAYKTAIQDFQRIRNKVNEKKHVKKEKSKLKKKAKLQLRKHRLQNPIQEEQKENKISNSEDESEISNNNQMISQVPSKPKQRPSNSKTKPIEKFDKFQKKGRTEFKKTGRNKVLQQKRQKKKGGFQDLKREPADVHKTNLPTTKFDRLNKGQPLHPSWQAKRQIKGQMFIQPFQGKKILL